MSHQSELIATDIGAYLKQHEQKDLLRFITCGSVDDGKSTLIGRLLHDSKLIFEDQLASLERDSKRFNTTDQEIDLALLVDGLQAEREQGITIDVAYRYFSTDRRKFIIADCPGHEQYTRNMATGASTCNLAIILIDARHGIQTQTRRHSFIVDQLGIRHVRVAINKMDLVGYDQDVFEHICADYRAFAERLSIPDIQFVPISALRGDQVVSAGNAMPWYSGPTLMQMLERVELSADDPLQSLRLPVQLVIRPNLDFRGFSGTIAAGILQVGDSVKVLPSGNAACIRRILVAGHDAEQACAGQAVTVTLDREIDISRGDMLVHSTDDQCRVAQRLTVQLVWMQEDPLRTGAEYLLKIGGRMLPCTVEGISFKTNINTLEHESAAVLALNEIGQVQLRVHLPVAVDTYRTCRITGALILIDRTTNATAAAGMVLDMDASGESVVDGSETDRMRAFEKELNVLVRRYFPHWNARAIE